MTIKRKTLTRKDVRRKTGKFIRRLRLKKRLTPKEAALLCGCSLRQWTRYEQNGVQATHAFLKIVLSLDTPASMAKLLEKAFPPSVVSAMVIGGFQDHIERNMNSQEIAFHLRGEKRLRAKKRLQALLWLAKGKKIKDVGKRMGLRNGLIQQWLGRYYKSGISWR